ncbi:hypothetical protein KY330_03870 [Candidatus Woesearchaeota archaeon]|nr:hypothetical protein [Candidatus Woesearchaeota archaeon]
MKKLLIIWIIALLCLNLVSAEVDWDSEDALSDENFENNFKEDPVGAFKNAPDKAWQFLNTKPDLLKVPALLEAAFSKEPSKVSSIINNNIALLEDSSILSQFDSAAKDNVDILNNNPKAKKVWFENKGITDEGTKVKSYDGSILITDGPDSTTFNINEHPGARILASGKLVLANGAEISQGEIKLVDGTYHVSNSNIDLSKAGKGKFQISSSSVKIGNSNFESQQDFTVERDAGSVTITGDVIESLGNTILNSINGKIKINSPNSRELFPGTSYTIYKYNKPSRTYSVSGLTELNTLPGLCSGTSCITDLGTYLKITAKDNNNIELDIKDITRRHLFVDKIDDDSTLNVKESNVKLTFSKNPLVIQGDIQNLNTMIESSFTDSDGNLHFQYLQDGKVTQCSDPCKVCGNSISSSISAFEQSIAEKKKKLQDLWKSYQEATPEEKAKLLPGISSSMDEIYKLRMDYLKSTAEEKTFKEFTKILGSQLKEITELVQSSKLIEGYQGVIKAESGTYPTELTNLFSNKYDARLKSMLEQLGKAKTPEQVTAVSKQFGDLIDAGDFIALVMPEKRDEYNVGLRDFATKNYEARRDIMNEKLSHAKTPAELDAAIADLNNLIEARRLKYFIGETEAVSGDFSDIANMNFYKRSNYYLNLANKAKTLDDLKGIDMDDIIGAGRLFRHFSTSFEDAQQHLSNTLQTISQKRFELTKQDLFNRLRQATTAEEADAAMKGFDELNSANYLLQYFGGKSDYSYTAELKDILSSRPFFRDTESYERLQDHIKLNEEFEKQKKEFNAIENLQTMLEDQKYNPEFRDPTYPSFSVHSDYKGGVEGLSGDDQISAQLKYNLIQMALTVPNSRVYSGEHHVDGVSFSQLEYSPIGKYQIFFFNDGRIRFVRNNLPFVFDISDKSVSDEDKVKFLDWWHNEAKPEEKQTTVYEVKTDSSEYYRLMKKQRSEQALTPEEMRQLKLEEMKIHNFAKNAFLEFSKIEKQTQSIVDGIFEK